MPVVASLAHAFAQHASALAQVLLIDVTLAGDNAVVVGLAVAGLPAARRRRAILAGVAAATLIRLGLALFAVRLIRVVGLTLAGGLLLLWVAWRMARELRAAPADAHAASARGDRGFGRALLRIVLADLSMSLDNVLAVAGAAGRDTLALAVGLAASVALMAAAAEAIAGLLQRARWIGWAGLALVLYVALHMIWQGAHLVIGAALG